MSWPRSYTPPAVLVRRPISPSTSPVSGVSWGLVTSCPKHLIRRSPKVLPPLIVLVPTRKPARSRIRSGVPVRIGGPILPPLPRGVESSISTTTATSRIRSWPVWDPYVRTVSSPAFPVPVGVCSRWGAGVPRRNVPSPFVGRHYGINPVGEVGSTKGVAAGIEAKGFAGIGGRMLGWGIGAIGAMPLGPVKVGIGEGVLPGFKS